jgi:hypothetical protein
MPTLLGPLQRAVIPGDVKSKKIPVILTAKLCCSLSLALESESVILNASVCLFVDWLP